MTTYVDTLLYTPSVEVTKIDKTKREIEFIDLSKNKKGKHLLHQSKQNGKEFYFRVGNQTYWLHLLFKK